MTMVRRSELRAFLRDDRGAVVVDHIPVFFFLTLIVLLIFEIGIAHFLLLRSHKAAQLGARMAVTLPAAHPGVPSTHERATSLGDFNVSCYSPSGVPNCVDPGGPWVCTGTSSVCNQNIIDLIVADMQRTFPDLDASDVTISYIHHPTLGTPGGPYTPEVNVAIAPQAYEFVLFTLGRDFLNEDDQYADSGETTYSAVSASAFGESMRLGN